MLYFPSEIVFSRISANKCLAASWLWTIDEWRPWDTPAGVTNVITTPRFIPVISINKLRLDFSFSSYSLDHANCQSRANLHYGNNKTMPHGNSWVVRLSSSCALQQSENYTCHRKSDAQEKSFPHGVCHRGLSVPSVANPLPIAIPGIQVSFQSVFPYR